MECSMPGFPVHHKLPELVQTHAIELVMPFNHLILSCPLLLPPSILPSIRSLPMSQSSGVSASASVLPMNIQDWFPLGLNGLISLQSKGLSRVFSNTTVQKTIDSLVLSFLYGPALTSIHDYWKNHIRTGFPLTIQTFVGKVMSLFFNMLSRFVIAFLPGNKHLFNFMAAVTIHSDFGAQENKACHWFHCFPIYLPWSDGTGSHDLSFLMRWMNLEPIIQSEVS